MSVSNASVSCMWHQRLYACLCRMNRAAAVIWWVLRVRVRCAVRTYESVVPGIAISASIIATTQLLPCNKYPSVLIGKNVDTLEHYLWNCALEIFNFLFSAAILDAILNISANFVMEQHIVIVFVSIAFLDHANYAQHLEFLFYLPYSRRYKIFCYRQTSWTPSWISLHIL